MHTPTKQSTTPRLHKRWLLLLPAALTALAVYGAWNAQPDPIYWQQLVSDVRAYLKAHPLVLIVLLATLPGLGLPMSPLLVLFGMVIGPRYGMPLACLIGIAATSLCTSWTYALASGPLRRLLQKHLLSKWTLPELSEHSALRLGLIIRITPGIPYPLQNIVLGVMRLRFKTYLLVSLPIQSVYTTAFIVTGGALFEGEAGLALTGALLLVVIFLASRLLRHRASHHVG